MDTGDAYGVTVALLGPVRAWRDGKPLNVGPPLRQAVLAVLALNANRTVTRNEIIDAIWGEMSPASAINGVQVHVAGLRRVLEPDWTRGTPGRVLASGGRGYTLHLDDDRLDLDICSAHLRRGRSLAASGDLAGASDAFDSALRLWQGTTLAGVPGTFAANQRTRLEEMRLIATVERSQAMIALGRSDDLVAELTALAAEHPLREQIQMMLMTVLERTGRQADALSVYATTRARLIDELGVEPSPALRRLHREILTAAEHHDPPAEPSWQPAAMIPRQLPPALSHFVGRTGDLDALTALIDAHPDAADPVTIAAIEGTAGVGKTTLAIRWAHQVADRFPDGQLYANLRGFDPSQPPVAPSEALRGLLEAWAIPPDRIPAGLPEQTALYRSILAGKQVLIVLDNAASADQIRPLLPATPGCLALVTSRNQLTSLVATDGAYPLRLHLLSHDEARQLLTSRLSRPRVTAEPEAVDEIIDLCARLPLALAITAARAAHNPDFPLAALAAELRDEQARLDALDAGEPTTQARTVFSWSYQRLTSDGARLFRLLGLHPGPDVGVPAVASILGANARLVRSMLAELIRAGLLAEHSPGRYTFHDLLRAYATELAHTVDDEAERADALCRIFDHYLHTGHTAALLLRPARRPIISTEPRPGVSPEALTSADEGKTWFATEHPVLLAVIGLAVRCAADRQTWQLAWTLSSFVDRQGHWDELIGTNEIALGAAERAGDRDGQAYAHRILGKTYALLGQYDDAQIRLGRAIELFRDLDDRFGQASVLSDLAIFHGHQGHFQDAQRRAREALDLYREIGDRAGEGRALNQIGWYHASLGEFRDALGYCDQARVILHEVGDADMEAGAWDSLGYAHHHLGNLRRAITCYQRALDLRRALGDRYYQANTLMRLGDVYHAANKLDAAVAAWQQALDAFDLLEHPNADKLRDKLHRLVHAA